MIKAVANKKIYLDKPEYDYLLELKSMFGDDCFNDLFSTNDSGFITLITPPPNRHTPLAVMFFLLN